METLSWSEFLASPMCGFDVCKMQAFLGDFCQSPNGIYAIPAAEIINLLADRLVNTWFANQPDGVVPGCNLSMPFYRGISRAAVLIALGPDSGLSPDSVGLDTLLNDIADFSSGFLVRRKPEAVFTSNSN